jgi:micrococcal nuclease
MVKAFLWLSWILAGLISASALPSAASDQEVIQKLSGNGQRNLRPFVVKDKWEIQWDSKGSSLSITIYTADGKMLDVAATQKGAGSGSSYQPKAGEYYLQVTGTGEWTVTVVQLPSVDGSAEGFSGQVVAVLDGDMIEVLHENRRQRIRLNGIDCPEMGQAYATNAKQATSELVFGKEVTVHTHGMDKHGRTIADVLLPDGSNVNQRLVREGWCWWYQKHAPKDHALKQSEEEARAAKRGLWNDPDPLPPWVYRRLDSGVYP